MNRTKKYLFMIITVAAVISILFAGIYGVLFGLPRVLFDASLQEVDSETDRIPAVVVYGTLYTEDATLDVAQLCRNENKNSSFKEVLCVVQGKAYFVYSVSDELKCNWILASVDLKTAVLENICSFSDVKTSYLLKQDSVYKERNGYYANGQIILNDLETVFIYDIDSECVNSYKYEEYIFPEAKIMGEIVDSNTIALYTEGSKQTFSLSKMSDDSKGIEKVYELKNKRTWNGTPCLSHFFGQNSMQIIGDEIYAIGECLNFSGEAYAVILEYDRETRLWRFASIIFSGDTVYRNCYLVPWDIVGR